MINTKNYNKDNFYNISYNFVIYIITFPLGTIVTVILIIYKL